MRLALIITQVLNIELGKPIVVNSIQMASYQNTNTRAEQQLQ